MAPRPTAGIWERARLEALPVEGDERMRFEFGEFCYDTRQLQLFRREEPVHLTPKAMALLDLLLERRPAVVRHDQLFDALWPDVVVHHANLKNLVADLRGGADTDPDPGPGSGRSVSNCPGPAWTESPRSPPLPARRGPPRAPT